MFFFGRSRPLVSGHIASKLFDEHTFYDAFIKDLQNCQKEVIIESPYITSQRMKVLSPVISDLLEKDVRVYIVTRDPREQGDEMARQSEAEIHKFECIGVQVFICRGNHHRKLAILDRKITWEGSLNILSQAKSREFMRRIEDEAITEETLKFLNLEQYL